MLGTGLLWEGGGELLREEPARCGGAGEVMLGCGEPGLTGDGGSEHQQVCNSLLAPFLVSFPASAARIGQAAPGHGARVLVTLRSVLLACLLRPHSCLLLRLIPLVFYL